MASLQIFISILLVPLAILGLVCARYTGAALARVIQVKIQSLLILVSIEIVCVIGCIIHEIVLVGYPLELCFDLCQDVSLATAILSYFIAVTVFFVPAYYNVLTHRQIN